MYGYGAIAANYEYEHNFYVIKFKSVPWNLQKEIKIYGNQIASGGILYSDIDIYPGQGPVCSKQGNLNTTATSPGTRVLKSLDAKVVG